MTFIEENGKKIAAAICIASAFPLVSTVYAMETNVKDGTSDSIVTSAKVTNSSKNDENYIETSNNDSTVLVNTNIQDSISETVKDAVKESTKIEEHYIPKHAVQNKIEAEEPSTLVESSVIDASSNEKNQEMDIQPSTNQEIENVNDNTTNEDTLDSNIQDEQSNTEIENNENHLDFNDEQDVVDNNDSNVNIPENNKEATANSNQEIDNSLSNSTTEERNNENSDSTVDDIQAPEEADNTSPSEDVTNEEANPYADLNARIVESAKSLVNVTNGQWCTQVVQQALAGAGVSDAYQLWPDEYAGQYGYYTNDPQPGNLVYYNNGGRGVDHIAIYIGNGQAVHGNYLGKTVIETVNVGPGAPQYIQVCR